MNPFRLGPFEVLEQLGQGGMGDVYRARQEPFGRVVALKVMRGASLTQTDNARRFAREIELAASLSHPHLVKVLDGGTLAREGGDETSYIAMELVEGDTLGHVIEQNPVLPWTHAAAMGSRLCDGLAYLHARGILHRDVKPGNALLSIDGWVKLMDFGLARPQEATMMTADGAVVGTLQFMAPEVVKGASATAAADTWAVGCILYRMLTGRMHVKASGQADFIFKLQSVAIPPPIELNPDMPPALSELVMRLLARDPQARAADAAALAGELDDLLAEFADVTWDQVLTPKESLALLGRSGRPAPAPTPAEGVPVPSGLSGASGPRALSAPVSGELRPVTEELPRRVSGAHPKLSGAHPKLSGAHPKLSGPHRVSGGHASPGRVSGGHASPGRAAGGFATPRGGVRIQSALPATGSVWVSPARRGMLAAGALGLVALLAVAALRRPAPPPLPGASPDAPARASVAPPASASPPAPIVPSYTRSVLDLVRFLPRLRAGGKGAERALEEMRPLARAWIGDSPCPWVNWMAIEEWMADPRRGAEPPASPCGEKGPMELVDEKVFVRLLLRVKFRKPEPGIAAATLEQLASFPQDGRVWLTLGRILEIEQRPAEAKLAYGVGLRRVDRKTLGQKAEFLWCALARGLLLAPGHDLEREYWTFMEPGKEGRRALRGLGEALAMERGGQARYDAMLREGVKNARLRNEVADVLAEVLDEERLQPERAREEMYAFLGTRPDGEEVVSDRLMRHLMARGRVKAARMLEAGLASSRPWNRFTLAYLTADPHQAPHAPEAGKSEAARERQIPLEAFRLMEIGNYTEAAREAAALGRHTEAARERMKLAALDLLGRPDPAPWIAETVTEGLIKLRDPRLLHEATGAFSTPHGRPLMKRHLEALAPVEQSVPHARAVWLSRSERFAEAFDALRGLPPGRVRSGGRFPIETLEIAARPLWLHAAGVAVDPAVLERARGFEKLPAESVRLKPLVRYLANNEKDRALVEAWRLYDQTPALDSAILAAAWVQGAYGEARDWPEYRAQLVAGLRYRGYGIWILDEIRRVDGVVAARLKRPAAAGTARPGAPGTGP